MPIAMRCPTCGKNYQLLDEQAGLRVRCRECKTAFEVPNQPERLEVVTKLPGSRGPRVPEEDDLDVRPLTKKRSDKRTQIWVVSILGACLVLCALITGGVVIWVTLTGNPVKQITSSQPEPPPPPPPAPRAENPKPKDVEIPTPELKLPTVNIKDLDDAIQKLRTGNQFTRLRALEYINKQKPPADPAKKKAVLDAMDEAGKNDDIVKAAALLVRVNWEEFP